MVEFLVRKFVKDSEHIENAEVRTRYGSLAGVTGILCNGVLFIVKLMIGILLNSISVMADAFNNLSDAASSVISFVGMRMAGKPADKDHPFGHGRIEYITAFIVAFLVIEVGFTFFKNALEKIQKPEDISFRLVSVIILLLSVFVKIWLAYFNKKLGNKINSKVMKATAADAIGDVATTLVTIVSIVIFRVTGWNIDGFVGLIVALLVMWSGINIARETLEPLIGEAVDPQLYQQIKHFVENYDGILGSHDLIVHNYGPSNSMASIHAEVANDVGIEVSHEIIDRIEKEAVKELGIFLVIHMDPVEMKDDKVLLIREQVEKTVNAVDPQISIHDFRVVEGEYQANLIFDILIPHEYSSDKEEKLLAELKREIKELDSRYECVITVDKQFVAQEISEKDEE